MPDGADLLRRSGDARTDINNVAYNLDRLAQAFWVTGNREIRDRLNALSLALRVATDELREIEGGWVDIHVRGAEAASINMLRATFAGAALAAGTPEEKKAIAEVGKKLNEA